MIGSKSSLKRAFIFFVVTYIFSWTMFFMGHQLEVLPLVLVGIWGPTLMAITLTIYYYRFSGLTRMLKRFGRIKIPLQWWVLLLLLPVLIHLSGRFLWQLFYVRELGLGVDIWFSIPTIVMSFLIAGFGEELGWRGFALPRLQQEFSPLKASLILAAVHFFWHLPTYWLGQGIHNVPMIYALSFIFPWTIIFTWLYNRSGGSLIFAVGFHAISNTSLSLVRFMPLEEEVPITPSLIPQFSLPAELSGPI